MGLGHVKMMICTHTQNVLVTIFLQNYEKNIIGNTKESLSVCIALPGVHI
jgi:hypothetical protein